MDSGILDMKINLDVSQFSQLLSALMLLEGRQVQLTQEQLLQLLVGLLLLINILQEEAGRLIGEERIDNVELLC